MYFAYGSNLHAPQMHARCPGAEPIRAAVLSGYRLVFAGHSKRWGGGVANVVEDPSGVVLGRLYTMTDAHFQTLDGYEGHPERYRRHTIAVEPLDVDPITNGLGGAASRHVQAMTYIRVDDPPLNAPTLAYLATMAHAYGVLGFDLERLLNAASR